MSTGGSSEDVLRIIADAIEDARDGQLDSERLGAVRQLLLSDPAARRYYLLVNELNHQMATAIFLPAQLENAEPDRNRLSESAPAVRHFGRAAYPATAAALLVACVLGALLWNGLLESPQPVAAALEQASGIVHVTDAGAVTRVATPGTELRSGDTIRTQGASGSVVIVYLDGTRISLAGNTSLTFSGSKKKRMLLHGGTLSASVVPQPTGEPMIVATPQDEVQVLGTTFSLEVGQGETELSVRSGRVKVTRLGDGKSLEVVAGQRAVSSAAQLALTKIPIMADTWSEDFEEGLPEDWEIGKFDGTNLPPGSSGAVRAVSDATKAGGPVSIATQCRWTDGLFAVHDDSHLHITLKIRSPGWFNILILTRTEDGDPLTFAGNYIFDRQVWFGQPGDWGTVTIPLSDFRPLPPAKADFENAVPFQVLLSSPDKDRGLVVDRIWVTRGGPGVVESKNLKPNKQGK